MLHNGFKGQRLGITKISMSGNLLEVDVTFSDPEGLVHGHMKHRIDVATSEVLRPLVSALLNALVAIISRIHYQNPDSPLPTEEVRRGIAEALRVDTADESDGFEESGG